MVSTEIDPRILVEDISARYIGITEYDQPVAIPMQIRAASSMAKESANATSNHPMRFGIADISRAILRPNLRIKFDLNWLEEDLF